MIITLCAIVGCVLSLLLLHYSRTMARYINQLRADMDELEQRLLAAEQALARKP